MDTVSMRRDERHVDILPDSVQPTVAGPVQITVTLASMAALFGAMGVLAAVPSVSVAAVMARAAASGFIHGALATLGIVIADILFILVAVLGLSLLAEAMGGLFVLIKYVGGAYLVWLGVSLWRSGAKPGEAARSRESSLSSSFLAGFLITLGDQKAILFYLGFLPAFLDLSRISWPDTVAIVAISIVAVGGVKLIYAFLADRSKRLLDSATIRIVNRIAGTMLIAVGAFLVLTA